MAKVLGVGGIFFKSPDPEKLNAWYERWLGVKAEPGMRIAHGWGHRVERSLDNSDQRSVIS